MRSTFKSLLGLANGWMAGHTVAALSSGLVDEFPKSATYRRPFEAITSAADPSCPGHLGAREQRRGLSGFRPATR